MQDNDVKAAGFAVLARDTGRVLMLQRAHDTSDPAGGLWEFPGGGKEDGETPLEAAKREFSEETGIEVPRGSLQAVWHGGIYRGHVWSIARESQVTINPPHGERKLINPDDPDGDGIEVVAWWDPELLKGNPSVRTELRKSMAQCQAALNRDRFLEGKYDRMLSSLKERRSAKSADCPLKNLPKFLMDAFNESLSPPDGYSDEKGDESDSEAEPVTVIRIRITRILEDDSDDTGEGTKKTAAPGFFGEYGRYFGAAYNPWSKWWGQPDVDTTDKVLKNVGRGFMGAGVGAGAAAGGLAAGGAAGVTSLGSTSLGGGSLAGATTGALGTAGTGIRAAATGLKGVGSGVARGAGQVAGKIAPKGTWRGWGLREVGNAAKWEGILYGAEKGLDTIMGPEPKPKMIGGLPQGSFSPVLPQSGTVGAPVQPLAAKPKTSKPLATSFMTPEQLEKFRGPASKLRRFDGSRF